MSLQNTWLGGGSTKAVTSFIYTPKDVLQCNIFGSFQKKMSFLIFNRTLASTIVIPYLEKIEFATKIGLILFAASSVQHFVTKNHWSDVANCYFTNAFYEKCCIFWSWKTMIYGNKVLWKRSELYQKIVNVNIILGLGSQTGI